MARRGRSRFGFGRSTKLLFEPLEARQMLSVTSEIPRLLPPGLDPADFETIGPQLPESSVSQITVPAAPGDAPADAAAEPERFASAAELEEYLLELAVARYKDLFGKERSRYPWWGPILPSGDLMLNNEQNPSTTGSHSTTNTQEEGVDEGDLVETDGNFIYFLSARTNELLIFDALPAGELHVVSRTRVDGLANAMYLDGDRVTIISFAQFWISRPIIQFQHTMAENVGRARPSEVRVTVLDVADRAEPSLVSETVLDGFHVNSRRIDGKLYLTLNGDVDLPAPHWTPSEPLPSESSQPGHIILHDHRPIKGTYETEEAYRARVRPLLLAGLPHYQTRTLSGQGERELLTEPTQIYKPARPNDTSLTSVVVIDLRAEQPSPVGSATVMGTRGAKIYASQDHLYVFTAGWMAAENGIGGRSTTEIRKFRFTDNGVEYAAAGQIDGHLLNQFSASEHEGYLRVATTENNGGNSRNHLFVLEERGGELVVVGSVRGLAPGERVFSARFFGSRGFLVTFRQVDPLFALDLSDPTNPQVAGELKIPGFSNYLHPIDSNTLVGIGRDADPVTGAAGALKLSVFDVSDLAEPKLKDEYVFQAEGMSHSNALFDHHAVAYYPEYHTLAVPVSLTSPMRIGIDGPSWERMNTLAVFEVSPSLGIELRGRVDHTSDVVRSLRINDLLYSLADDSIKVSPILEPSQVIAEVVHGEDFVGWQFEPGNPSKKNLLVLGTSDTDRVTITTANGVVRVVMNGELRGEFPADEIAEIITRSNGHGDRVLMIGRRTDGSRVPVRGHGMPVRFGDTNNDGVVNLNDFAILKLQFGQIGPNLKADIDGDGDVDLGDLAIIKENFGTRASDWLTGLNVSTGFAHPGDFWTMVVDLAIAESAG